MSIYRRDEIDPEWEPAPWPMDASAADEQEQGFHLRALKSINWQPIPWTSFPLEGLFGHTTDWFSSIDAAFYAKHDGEDLILIDNVWNGWPDPPRWGLASRPSGQNGQPWSRWGHFQEIPSAWVVPSSC
jgi:hypothetical protein